MKRHQAFATQARMIARTLGMRRAAGFLRNRGFNLDSALVILIGKARS
jgi:hypothetical protein